MQLFWIWWLILHQRVCNAFLESNRLGALEDSYILDDLEYILMDQRLRWEEAEIGCSATDTTTLAIVDSPEKEKFLALALAETDLVVEDLWIGATLEPCTVVCNSTDGRRGTEPTAIKCKGSFCFKWIDGNYVDAGDIMIQRFTDKKKDVRECLSFARNYHQQPSFVDLNCRLKRPYICQRAAEGTGRMTHKGWIRIGDYEYAIFYAKKTWKESMRECFTNHKADLADFRGMTEVAGIGKYLLTGRPSLENAWFGGHRKFGHWRYISIDDIISDTMNMTTLYPPWPDPNEINITQQGCLLLDRHLEDRTKLIFLPAQCHMKKSYICSRKVDEASHNPFEVIVIDDVCYLLCYNPQTWDEANETCAQYNAVLVEATEEKIDHILYIMGENRTEINHIWLGARLMADNKWYWSTSNETVDNDSNHIFNGYPPWLDDKFDQDYACLNMDRENHNRALFYGVDCEARQPFICQKYDECSVPKPHDTTENPSATTTTEAEPSTVYDPWKWEWPNQKVEYIRLAVLPANVSIL